MDPVATARSQPARRNEPSAQAASTPAPVRHVAADHSERVAHQRQGPGVVANIVAGVILIGSIAAGCYAGGAGILIGLLVGAAGAGVVTNPRC